MAQSKDRTQAGAAPAASAGLLQNDIDRIVAEERLRERIRRELAPPTDARKRGLVLDFLNSPLGLFLLSSVLLAGLGKIYSDLQARNERERTTRAALVELLAELDLRGTQATYFAAQVERGPANQRQYFCVLLWRVLVGDPEYQPTSPTFRNVHWMGLLSRAKVLTGNAGARPAEHAVMRLELGTNGGRCDRAGPYNAYVGTLVHYTQWLAEQQSRKSFLQLSTNYMTPPAWVRTHQH